MGNKLNILPAEMRNLSGNRWIHFGGLVVLLLALAFAAAGCASTHGSDPLGLEAASTNGNQAKMVAIVPDTGSTLRVGDYISISFTDVPPIASQQFKDQKIRIPDDGMITLPYNVKVQAKGKTIPELEADIRVKYVPGLFQNFTAIVTPQERVYYVGGQVRAPGRQPYIGEVTVLRAIETAGGFTDFARRSNIEVRRQNGTVQRVNWNKINQNPKLDLQIFPNDYIIVHKGI